MSNIVTSAIQRLSHLFTVSFAAAILSSCIATTEGIRIRVVDADTDKAIEDAVVIYELHAATGHGTNYTQKAIYEAVSNDSGWAEIPPQKINTVVTSGLRPPTLKIFRSGYNPEFLSNAGRIIPTLQEVLRWTRNGQTIRLKRPENFQEYAWKIDFLNGELEHLYRWPNDNPCGWKAIPRAVMAVEWEVMQFEASGKRRNNSTVLRDLLGNEAYSRGMNKIVRRCGSPTEFFKNYSIPCPDGSSALRNIQRRAQIDEVSHTGISIVLFTLGYCKIDSQYWLFEQGVGWRRTQKNSLGFIRDKRYAK
jgi:hypothetical protein